MTAEVIAVIGACAAERRNYAEQLAHMRGSASLSAECIAEDPTKVHTALRGAKQDLVIEFPLQIPALHVIGELTDTDASVELTDVVCLVDAVDLFADLTSDEYVQVSGHDEGGSAIFASRAELVVTQIEYCSASVLINTGQLSADELNLLLSLISHLAPKARLDLAETAFSSSFAGPLGAFSDEQTHAGWVSLLNGDFAPQFEDPRITAVRYEQLRPLHPGRIQEVICRYTHSCDRGMLLRSAGFVHMATRAHITAHWNQVGGSLSLFPAAFDHQLSAEDEPLAFGQDLALIGIDLDTDRLTEDLDWAALTNLELAQGPTLWATFPDPFPEWRTADR